MQKILELNNVDLPGHRLNGYNLQQYIKSHPELDLCAKMAVCHKFSKNKDVIKIYSPSIEHFDYKIEEIEKTYLSVKNQLSIAEPALTNLKEYKDADILHFHMYHNMNLPISFLERIPKEKKIIIDVHDTFFLTDDCPCKACSARRGNKKPIPTLEVFSFTHKNCHSLNNQKQDVLSNIDATFIVHSQFMLDLFKSSPITKNIKKIHLIPFGININKFRDSKNQKTLKQKYSIPPENIVLFCRAQEEFKGIQYVNKACQIMDSKYPITIITVSGTGMLSSLADKYQIIDFGLVKDEPKMIELYNLCDIFLSPSTEESFGLMAVEAMACGKPVIVFDGTALPYTTFAPGCGVVVPKSDHKKLARAISTLVNDKSERTRRGKMARALAKKHYDDARYHASIAKLYLNLPARHPRKLHRQTSDNPILEDKIYSHLQKIMPSVLSSKAILPAPHKGSIDYSLQSTQDTLFRVNEELYQTVMKKFGKITPVFIARKIIPEPIKKKIRRFYAN